MSNPFLITLMSLNTLIASSGIISETFSTVKGICIVVSSSVKKSDNGAKPIDAMVNIAAKPNKIS